MNDPLMADNVLDWSEAFTGFTVGDVGSQSLLIGAALEGTLQSTPDGNVEIYDKGAGDLAARNILVQQAAARILRVSQNNAAPCVRAISFFYGVGGEGGSAPGNSGTINFVDQSFALDDPSFEFPGAGDYPNENPVVATPAFIGWVGAVGQCLNTASFSQNNNQYAVDNVMIFHADVTPAGSE